MLIGARKNKYTAQHGNGVMSGSAKMIRWTISIVLIVYTLSTMFVIGATLFNSLKTKGDLISNFVGLPKVVTYINYFTILFEDNFLLYFKNSLVLTICGTTGSIILAAMAAYGIARYEFRGKTWLSGYFLVGMMVPIQVTVLPLFLILRTMGLLNHLIGLILVYISEISMSCLIFQKFFKTIPTALEESARLDGCHDLKIFFMIIMPICKPVIFTMALITAIAKWNDFYMPMIILGNKYVKTLTLVIYQYIGQFTKYMGESMAAVIISLIPIIVIYFLFSSQIVEGLTGGAVKG